MFRLLTTISFVFASKLPADYFYGRSGELLVRSTQKNDASIVYLSEFDLIRPTEAAEPLNAQDIANTVARALGVVPPQQSTAPSFLKTSFFHRAQANLFIALDGVGSSNFESMPNLQAFNQGTSSKGQVQPVTLETERCSFDSVSLLSCLSSGYPASKTGIVGSNWKSVKGNQTAFSSPDSFSIKANLADRVVQSFDGQSLAVSFSMNDQQAAAFCVNPQLAKTAQNSFCLHPETSSASIILPRSKEDISSIFVAGASDSLLSFLIENGLEVSFASNSLSVSLDNNERGTLDLQDEEDLNFLLEVQSFHSISRALVSNSRLNSLVKDDAPDVYFAAFSTLRPMTSKHGAESAKVRAARRILDASIAVFLRSWAQLYEGKALVEVVALGSAVDMKPALRKVQQVAPELTGVESYFPAVHIPQSSSRVCETIRDGLKGTSFEVVCYLSDSTLAHGRSLLQEEGEETVAPTTAAPTTVIPGISSTERDTYQIMVWVSVSAAFVVFFAFYNTAFMSFKKDTLLYSSFNPKWDDRKNK